MLLTVKEVAERLKVSASCIYQLVESGRLAHHRIGIGRGAIRFSENDLDEFLKKSREQARQSKSSSAKPHAKLKHLKL